MSTPDETGRRPNPESGSSEPAPLDDAEQTRRRELQPRQRGGDGREQDDPLPDAVAHDADIDTTRINAVPGTGGPDDAGDVDSIPRMSSADGVPSDTGEPSTRRRDRTTPRGGDLQPGEGRCRDVAGRGCRRARDR